MAAQAGTAEPDPRILSLGKSACSCFPDSLVRLELQGPEGFENRATFHVVNRDWPGTAFTTNTNAGDVVIRTANYTVRVPQNAKSLDGVRVESTERTIALCL